MASFYDELAPLYHLVYSDWNASIERQAEQLSSIIAARWPAASRILDAACGIGTQTIGLAGRGYSLVGSDLSPGAVRRAVLETRARGLSVALSVCDMRAAYAHHGSGFDVVLCADNSLPHLLTDDDILTALQQFLACLCVGGGCIITVRDYVAEERGQNLVKPHGVRLEHGSRYLLFQVWDFEGDCYQLAFYFVEEHLATGAVRTHVMRSRYYAISTARLCALMERAGFRNVSRLDGVFYQPVLVGTK
ncbi:MAG: class I SAM-dependent methyltransferase [Rhodospirillales bacterium]|nr:class I SAM-dependent methyltransferase [Rhodospirillales bacterium]